MTAPSGLAVGMTTAAELGRLGTTVTVWAHPDDETYLAAGVMAALRDADQRVVCVTATRGDAGNGLHLGGSARQRAQLGALRARELADALAQLGVTEHHWLGYADGGLAAVDPGGRGGPLSGCWTRSGPTTVLAFGPDGFTGHPDHTAVSRWVTAAVAGCRRRPRLLYASATPADLAASAAVDERFGVYALGRPRLVEAADLARPARAVGSRAAAQGRGAGRPGQPDRGIMDAIGRDAFAAWVRAESFVAAGPG